jgi:transcriptional regulator GlxA family with amidase domain
VSTELAMPEVASKSGFASAAWFSKTFLQLTGQTPTNYRRQFRHSPRG